MLQNPLSACNTLKQYTTNISTSFQTLLPCYSEVWLLATLTPPVRGLEQVWRGLEGHSGELGAGAAQTRAPLRAAVLFQSGYLGRRTLGVVQAAHQLAVLLPQARLAEMVHHDSAPLLTVTWRYNEFTAFGSDCSGFSSLLYDFICASCEQCCNGYGCV